MRIEALYIADCPHHRPTVDRLLKVMRDAKISEQVVEIEVCTLAQAEKLRFLGSPTIRINGVDVEPEARAIDHFGIGCRSYLDKSGRRSGLPSEDLLRLALSQEIAKHNPAISKVTLPIA